jgi:hypothetical protein
MLSPVLFTLPEVLRGSGIDPRRFAMPLTLGGSTAVTAEFIANDSQVMSYTSFVYVINS